MKDIKEFAVAFQAGIIFWMIILGLYYLVTK